MENNSEFLEKNGYLILENFVSEDNLNKIKKVLKNTLNI